MSYKKVSKNFYYYEFRPYGKPKLWMPSSSYQCDLINSIGKNLQVVRSEFPAGAYMMTTSAVRTLADRQRLIGKGYNPSETSDHYYGEAPTLKRGTYKYKKYGATYNFAMGAVDIVSVNFPISKMFDLAVELTKQGRCDFGQIIHESSPNGKEWVHFGGDPKPFLSPDMVKFLNRVKYMISADNGHTYKTL